MRNLKLIIVREYLARVRNKSFIIMTFLSPIIFVLMIMLIVYLTSLSSGGMRTVGIFDPSEVFVEEFSDSPNMRFQDFSMLSLEDAKTIVRESEYYGLLVIPLVDQGKLTAEVEFYALEAPGFGFLEGLEEILANKLTKLNLNRMGINTSAIEQAQGHVTIQVQDFSGNITSELSTYVKVFFGGAAGYLLMMFIIIYGNMVMRSVIEEKTNRIVEIIISSVKPVHLMLGKILGTSLAGISQFLIWVLLGSVMLFGVTAITGINLSQGDLPQQQLAQDLMASQSQQVAMDILQLPLLSLTVFFLIYFICGYFLYSSIYAAIGAAVDNETDTQQFIFPLVLPQMLGIYVGFFSVIENPHGSIATIFSMIPLTSPIVMLMRIPFGVPWWELLVSLLLLVATIAGVVWLASKIYRIGILTYGKKPSYKELLKWLKY